VPRKTPLFCCIHSLSDHSQRDLEQTILSKTHFSDDESKARILAGLRWIGLFSDEEITPRGTPLDTLCATLEQKMQYGPGERDMVMLQHKFDIEWKDGSKETRTSTLLDYGDPSGYSSMAKLVGKTCGVAVKLVLDGTISDKGVIAPMTMRINEPLMRELEKLRISMTERVIA
jgi:saccharopine dehydrogenase (NADP+, L-glutamate forming)